MASDILQRLRSTVPILFPLGVLCNEAADHIESQALRIAELEKALQPFANAVFNDNGDLTVNLSVDSENLISAYFALRGAVVLSKTETVIDD